MRRVAPFSSRMAVLAWRTTMGTPAPYWEYWLKCDLWTLDEAVWLLLGREPVSLEYLGRERRVRAFSRSYLPSAQAFLSLMSLARRAIDGKTIETVKGWWATGDSWHRPADVVLWAHRKGIEFPDELKPLLEDVMAPVVQGYRFTNRRRRATTTEALTDLPTQQHELKAGIESRTDESPRERQVRKTKERYERWQARIEQLADEYHRRSYRWLCERAAKQISEDPSLKGTEWLPIADGFKPPLGEAIRSATKRLRR